MIKQIHLYLNNSELNQLNEMNVDNLSLTKLVKYIIHDYYIIQTNKTEEDKILSELNIMKNILLKQNKQIEQKLKSNNDKNNNSKESITDKEVLSLNKNLFDYYIKNNELSDRQIVLWYKHYNDKLEMVDDTYGI